MGTVNRIHLAGIAIIPLLFCVVGIAMLSAGCSIWESRAAKASSGSTLFNTIEKGLHSDYYQSQPVTEPFLMVFGTKEQFALFWGRHHGSVVPPPPVPDVDFARYDIIALMDRVEPSGGYAIEIKGVESGGERGLVRAVKRSPGRGCATSQALTQPYHIIMVEKGQRDFALTLQEVTSSCDNG